MGIEDERFSAKYARGRCQRCYISRNCNEAAYGVLCRSFRSKSNTQIQKEKQDDINIKATNGRV